MIHNLVLKRQAPSLVQGLANGLIEGFNHIIDCGRVDRAAANVMVGYLSAAVIALRSTGNDWQADLFQAAASNLRADWRTFEGEIRSLVNALRE